MTSRWKRESGTLWRLATAALATSVVVVAGASTSQADFDDDDEIPFDVAEVFFELNDTDGDLGLHALIDGEPWRRVNIEDPRGRKMLWVSVLGRLRRQGLTELFFESAEPVFDELDPEVFFRRFPAGTYEVEGYTLGREELESETELTHVIPAPPDFTVNGEDAEPGDGEECDEENLPELSGEVVIDFDAVTMSHPELGDTGVPVEILRYRVVAEYEDDDENVFVSEIDLAPGEDSYSVTIPESFLADGIEVKFEVLARESSFNQTAVESCPFEYVDD